MGPLVVTNAPNYRHYRTHGIVGPEQLFGEKDKYYVDFLQICEGRIPLFRPPISEDVLKFVEQSSRRSARPVILELDATWLPDATVEGLDLEGNPKQCLPGSSDVLVTAPSMVLPFGAVKQIHVLDDEGQELLLRDKLMANLRNLPRSMVRVTPEIRGETELSLDALTSWLSDLREPRDLRKDHFVQADKTAGLVMLFGSRRKELGEDALKLLDGNLHGDETDLPEWIVSSDRSHLRGYDPDSAVYQATQSVVRDRTPKEFVPSEILEEIQANLSEDILAKDDASVLVKGINKISRILRNEQPFDEVKSQEYPALQGLMFFLIKQSPEHLLNWYPADTNSSEEAHLTSIAYSGLLYGRANLQLEYRPEELDGRVGRVIADKLSPLSDRSRLHPGQIFDEADLEPRQLLSWKMENIDLETDGAAKDAALHLCKMEGWKDCVKTKIIAPDRQPVSTYQTQEGGENRKYKMAWSFNGVPDINYRIDVGLVSQYLRERDISDSVIHDVLGMLEGGSVG